MDMTPPVRTRLPDRRTSRLYDLVFERWIVTVDVGFDGPGGRPLEVFLDHAKRDFDHPDGRDFTTLLVGAGGFDVPAMLNDFAVAISVALQHGIPPAALAKSMGRAPNVGTAPGSFEQLAAGPEPASPIGAALDLLCSLEAG